MILQILTGIGIDLRLSKLQSEIFSLAKCIFTLPVLTTDVIWTTTLPSSHDTANCFGVSFDRDFRPTIFKGEQGHKHYDMVPVW